VVPTVALRDRLRKSGWTTTLRYETMRLDTRRAAAFLDLAVTVCKWVEGQLT
jgi:hypothetical protein